MRMKAQISINRHPAGDLQTPDLRSASGRTVYLLRSNTGQTGPRSGLQVGGRKEPKHRRTPAYQHTPILTHKQGCVTASKIRPVAPGCLLLFHTRSRLCEPLHPFRALKPLFLPYATCLRGRLHGGDVTRIKSNVDKTVLYCVSVNS